MVPLGFWGEADYRASWRRAFEVLEGDPRAVACLMTSMTDPATSNFLICWPMYREGEDVYVQNAIVLLDEIEGPFDPGAPWGSLEPRQEMDDDGNRISEWATSHAHAHHRTPSGEDRCARTSRCGSSTQRPPGTRPWHRADD